MSNPFFIALGKAVQGVARLRGGGSSLPGLVVEKLDRDFAVRLLQELPYGVVVISGTNGKTTTTKIVCELIRNAGLRVFTNTSGSNFMRGVISSLLRCVTLNGHLEADIAVLELDEAHAVDFAQRVRPRHTLLLNVMRDQLDRFGEIDHTANLLARVARATTTNLVLNREDCRVAAIATHAGIEACISYYALSPELTKRFPQDDELYARNAARAGVANSSHSDSRSSLTPAVTLTALEDNRATYEIAGTPHTTHLALKGIYNAYNAAAALALVRAILPEHNVAALVFALSQITGAFGRGEVIQAGGTPVELLLVKNPAGFRLALESFSGSEHAIMIAINDDYADGRDMSWLYDVSFTSLRERGVCMVSGARAYDMALRLQYDEIPFSDVETDIPLALATFLAEAPDTPHRIYCTYTAMLALRKTLTRYASVCKVM